MLAVIELGGKQYLIEEGSVIEVEKVPHKVGDKFDIPTVLLAFDKTLNIGRPKLTGVNVEAQVLDQFRAKKVKVFRYRPKKRYKKMKGHRQQLSKIKIIKIKN